jgi:hypothetical protein
MVHHTSPGFIWSSDRPTSGYNRLGDRPDLYISWSSSLNARQLDNQPTIEDNQVVDDHANN